MELKKTFRKHYQTVVTYALQPTAYQSEAPVAQQKMEATGPPCRGGSRHAQRGSSRKSHHRDEAVVRNSCKPEHLINEPPYHDNDRNPYEINTKR